MEETKDNENHCKHTHTHTHTHLHTCVVSSSLASRLLSRSGADLRYDLSRAAAGADLDLIDSTALLLGVWDLDLVWGSEEEESSMEMSDSLEASWLELQPGRGRCHCN